jgi:outer membrane protein assembly factor BamE (lipoprotein component of BamABCDE complex)
VKTQLRSAKALVAVALLTAGTLAFADGFIKSPELLDKIRIGETTSQQVTEILGRPARVAKFPRREVEAWDYTMRDGAKGVEVSIEIDSKGVVRNVQKLVRYGP